MKYSIAFSAVAQVASAHYFFDTTILNGAESSPNEYIRASTRETAYNPIKFSGNPAADIRDDSKFDEGDGICNQGAFQNAGSTSVLEVAAGEELSVKLGVGATMEHPGPGLVYMSHAPSDDVVSYDGTGDWFKIFEEGVCNESGDFTTDAWCTWGRDTLTATIPAGVPSGEYLVRFEHIGVHRSHVNQPEHYISCVQVKVTDGGSGEPGPTVQFPAAYSLDDDYANFNIYNGAVDFPFPGPAVWDGAGSSASSSGSSSESSSDSSSAAPSASAAPSSESEQSSDSSNSASQADETTDDISTSGNESFGTESADNEESFDFGNWGARRNQVDNSQADNAQEKPSTQEECVVEYVTV